MRRRPIPHRAWRLGALLVFVALCIVGCAPVSGDGGLEVYLRSDLSDSEREQVRFTVHLWARGGVDEAAPLALDARTLDRKSVV